MGEFVEIASGFFVRNDVVECFRQMSLESIDDVFAFKGGVSMTKENLADFRRRIMFETENPKTTLFLKRYQNIPKSKQLKNWLSHRKRISMMDCDKAPSQILNKFGINTPKTIAFGQEFTGLFENRSFIITEKVPDSQSLEKQLPDLFYQKRKEFIQSLARFVRKFHDTGFRHRDLYLCHIFCNGQGGFTLIDLARVFKPAIFSKRYLVKDLAQLYYSSPGDIITKTDRLRFLLAYLQKDELSFKDKIVVKKIKSKARQMAKHDRKHGRTPPFEKTIL